MTVIIPSFETIEVEISELYTPILIDLNHLFGREDLNYSVNVVKSGVVSIDSRSSEGMLLMTAEERAASGDRTQVEVCGIDSLGALTVMRFEVVAVDLSFLYALQPLVALHG